MRKLPFFLGLIISWGCASHHRYDAHDIPAKFSKKVGKKQNHSSQILKTQEVTEFRICYSPKTTLSIELDTDKTLQYLSIGKSMIFNPKISSSRKGADIKLNPVKEIEGDILLWFILQKGKSYQVRLISLDCSKD